MDRFGWGAALGAVALACASSAAAEAAGSLEVRFCPGAAARSYPLLDPARIQSLVLHNLAVVNRGAAAASVRAIEIELDDKGQAMDLRRFEGPALDAAAKGGSRAKASGQIEMIAFQYCDGRLLAGSTAVSDDAALAPGEAILIQRQVFAWRGARDQVKVRVFGQGGEMLAAAALPIDGSLSRTQFRFPLSGRWVAVVGATPHGGHRWVLPEEFALDIAAFGADSRSFKATGERFEDYYAYGATVLAAADGVVVKAADGQGEDRAVLRRPGEALEAYAERVGAIQGALLAKGEGAIAGNHVMIDHGNGEYSLYAHLKPGSVGVKAGQKIKAGEAVGRLGSSGNSTEPHLHFQVCDAPDPLHCAGIPPNFTGIELPYADGPRLVQSGDVVLAP